MRIGVVTASYPRVEGDHAGNFVAAHVAALRAAGHTVEVIGAHTIASPLFDGAGAPDELERGDWRTYLAAARFSAQLTREVARRSSEWDLVIAHWLAPSALAALIGTGVRRRVPILAIVHGGDLHTLRRLHLLAPVLHALRARDVRLAFVSGELRDQACAAAPRLALWLATALVQPMGIDVARFAALRDGMSSVDMARSSRATHTSSPDSRPPASAQPATNPRRTVAIVARLVPVKGVDVALRALALLRTPVRLVIAGDGPERAALASLADTHAVELLGTIDATRRDELLRSADCIVIPSRVLANGRSEGTPMIAMEALAAGVPVIASAVGGLRDLPGIVHVRADDPAALATAIDRVLADPAAFVTPTADLAELDWSGVSARLLDHATAPNAPQGPVGLRSCEGGDSTNRPLRKKLRSMVGPLPG